MTGRGRGDGVEGGEGEHPADEPGAGAHKGHEECFAAGEGRKVKSEHKRMKKK